MPNFAERLRDRIRVLEGWSAMQAHPHLDQRIISVLTMLAEQFGVLHAHGLLIDVRITHAQLATAVGATRSTVTRLLSDLRTRGNLTTVGRGENERYCLCRWEHTDHLQPRQALQVSVR
jgi:CRP-like cAMP-binding protein